jgi:hypothetical protein
MPYSCSSIGDASGFRGCGRTFGSLAAFDRHWTTVGQADHTNRDRSGVTVGGTRCATDQELRRRRIEIDPRGVWRDVSEADRVRQARAGGSFLPRRQHSQAFRGFSRHGTPDRVVAMP